MLPCDGCAYRKLIPGNRHLRCVFDWIQRPEDLPPDPPPGVRKWFRFPFNYDPVWGPDMCAARAQQQDPTHVALPNVWADLLSLLP